MLSGALGVIIEIFDTQAPVLRMGEQNTDMQEGLSAPIRLTYHRHYYALGSIINCPSHSVRGGRLKEQRAMFKSRQLNKLCKKLACLL